MSLGRFVPRSNNGDVHFALVIFSPPFMVAMMSRNSCMSGVVLCFAEGGLDDENAFDVFVIILELVFRRASMTCDVAIAAWLHRLKPASDFAKAVAR